MRNRCILSLFACFGLLYYAWPKLHLHGSGLQFYFSWAWLLLLVFAIAGNFAGVLFSQSPVKREEAMTKKKVHKQKARTYQS